MDAQYTSTRLSLLHRLKHEPNDQASWSEFVACYEPMIIIWCRSFGLQHADANDVAQNVLLRIAKYIRNFERRQDGHFRSWLKTVVHNAWRDFIQSQKEKGSGDEAVFRMLDSVQAHDDLLERVDTEYDQQLLKEAMEIVSKRVQPHIWKAFEMLGIEGVPVDCVSEQLNITTGSAYVSKNRVQKMLAAEIFRLDSVYA